MRIGVMRFSWVAALAASWGLTWVTNGTPAQDRTGKGILSGLSARKEIPRPATVNPNRVLEVQVELALMGDPVTFPYFLEARTDGTKLELRGFVPDKGVQDHALKLARLNSPLTVVDATRVHPSIAVKTTRLAPEKLAPSVHRAISKVLPDSSKTLQVECDAEGRVGVKGTVKSLEEKILVSQSLRRLHGCAYVMNATDVEGMASAPTPHVVASALLRTTTPPSSVGSGVTKDSGTGIYRSKQRNHRAVPVPAPIPEPDEQVDRRSEGPFGGFFGRMFGKKKPAAKPEATEPLPARFPPGTQREPVKITNAGDPLPKGTGWGTPPRPASVPATPTGKSSTPTAPAGPYEASGVIVAPETGGAAPKKGRVASPAQVKAKIESAFPKARPVAVTPEGGNKLKIELSLRSSSEIDAVAGRVLSLPELESYDVNLSFRIDTPAAKER